MAVGSAACWISIWMIIISYLVVPLFVWWIKLSMKCFGWTVGSKPSKHMAMEVDEDYVWEPSDDYYEMTWVSSFSNQ